MKRLMFFLSAVGICIFYSCGPEPTREQRMHQADANMRMMLQMATEGSNQGNPDPGADEATNGMINTMAAVASEEEGRSRNVALANQINPFPRVSRNLLLDFNPYEADGDMHNDAIDLIVREQLAGVDVVDKLKNKDRQTIDKFLKLSPKFQDENVRNAAVDAIVATEVPDELKDKAIKITNAKDYIEGISYLDLAVDEKAIVTEVFATCNDYYVNKADFVQVASYLNSKIISLFDKGENMTVRDQQFACMFTILKHSYYYWHGAK
jgi:hypothetical protein